MKRMRGFTLQEVMISISLLTVVMGSAYSLHVATIRCGDQIVTKMAVSEEGSRVMMGLSRIIPRAMRGTLALLPDGSLEFMTVDGKCRLGLDTEDINRDGLRETQFVFQNAAGCEILTSNLLPIEDKNGNNIMDAGEDILSNSSLDRGLKFVLNGDAVTASIITSVQMRFYGVCNFRIVEVIRARN
jgi:prepilin-type N-terminal cleavage/methylation domain-containing protein